MQTQHKVSARTPQTLPEPRAFTEEAAAAYCSVSRSYLRQSRLLANGRKTGTTTPGPKPTYIGRWVRYLREDLDAWLEGWSGGRHGGDAA